MLQAEPAYLQAFVDRLASCCSLTETEQMAILGLPGRLVHATPNVDFIKAGEPADHACYVVDGLVARFGDNSSGRRVITALHIPGEVANLETVVLPYTKAGLQALAPTIILQIPQSALRTVAAAHPAVAKAFWKNCMTDAMILAQWIVNVGHRDAKCRIAHLICEMALRYRREQLSGKVIYSLPMSQAHLAAATGLTSVHVNRCLGSKPNQRLDVWQLS